MGDMGEIFNAMKEQGKRKRANNRESSASLLSSKGVKFVTKNINAHLIVEGTFCIIDFWPGT